MKSPRGYPRAARNCGVKRSSSSTVCQSEPGLWKYRHITQARQEKQRMKPLYCGAFAVLTTIACFTQGQSAEEQVTGPDSTKARLIGAWHLVRIDAPGPDGK